jgi:hypothetical protein
MASHGGGHPRAVSKPCERGGCTGTVYAWGPRTLAARKFCSARCTALERVRIAGMAIPLTARQIGGFIGGRIAGDRRRRHAVARAVERVYAVLPVDILEALTRDQLARLRVALAQLDRESYRRGLKASSSMARRRARLAA